MLLSSVSASTKALTGDEALPRTNLSRILRRWLPSLSNQESSDPPYLGANRFLIGDILARHGKNLLWTSQIAV